jgi:lipopolysaccharide biosynthesis glycosyltransferase
MKIAFTTVLDDKYMIGFLVTFNSMLRASKNFNYDVVILEWGDLSDENKKIIKSLYDKVYFKKINTHLYENHKYDETWRTWTYNCNYRFDIFTKKTPKFLQNKIQNKHKSHQL